MLMTAVFYSFTRNRCLAWNFSWMLTPFVIHGNTFDTVPTFCVRLLSVS